MDGKDKIIKIIRNKMKNDVDESSMLAFRVGQKKENRKTPQVRFNELALKINIYRKKTSLRGTNCIMKEGVKKISINSITVHCVYATKPRNVNQ